MSDEELWEIERQFWLGDAAFYEQTLAPDALMVLPPPARILDRAATIRSILAAPRWKQVLFNDRYQALPMAGAVVLGYCVQATRGDEAPGYVAQCSSTYVRGEGGWRLALHHQTPISRTGSDQD